LEKIAAKVKIRPNWTKIVTDRMGIHTKAAQSINFCAA
jgi:hypothetical protein